MKSKSNYYSLYILLLMIFFLSPAVFAINVMPFSGELDLTKQLNYKLQVGNRSTNEVAVKISVKKWSFDRFGEETRVPTNELIVFPKRMLLKPKDDRSVRISYRNDVAPQREVSYRIIVEEVPLVKNSDRSGAKGASINVLTRYVTAFYVKPRNAESEIEIIESNRFENGFQLKIRNVGNAHTHFISPTITIEQKGKKLIITDLALLTPFTNTNIFASSDRVYEWGIPESLRSTLQFDQPYNVILDWICENCSSKKDKISFLVE